MVRTHRASAAAALIMCLLGSPSGGAALFASEPEPVSSAALPSLALNTTTSRSPFTVAAEKLAADAAVADASAVFAQRGYRGRGQGGRNGSTAAIVLGAAAAIAGAAVLTYANRPECRANQTADGCGYGTKVVGGAVLAGGMVGLIVGALTWR